MHALITATFNCILDAVVAVPKDYWTGLYRTFSVGPCICLALTDSHFLWNISSTVSQLCKEAILFAAGDFNAAFLLRALNTVTTSSMHNA